MRRHLFNSLAAISALLFVATVVLWVRSYRLMDEILWQQTGGVRWAWTAKGHLAIGILLADYSKQPASFFGFKYQRDQAMPPINFLLFMSKGAGDTDINWDGGGFALYARHEAATRNLHAMLVAPFWFIGAAMATPPLAWAARRRLHARRQRRLGLCPSCGYDLRATPNRCPECGATRTSL